MKKHKPYNPFLIAGYYSPEYFCDRETETAKIISALENDRNISLISPLTLRIMLSKELLEENTYAYQELLNAYSDIQINLLKAVAKEKIVAQINSGDFISKYRLKNSSSVSRALKKLLDNELIYKSEKGYMVYDRFLGLWL